LDQMNLQLHHVISDITGQTGLAVIDAILAGERNPKQLAQHRDRRIKADAETISQALVGDYREELLFTLKQAVQIWRQYQQQIAAVDKEIRCLMQKLETVFEFPEPPALASEAAPRKRGRPRGSHTPEAQMQRELHRIFGVDLTAIPGLQVATVRTLLSEVGTDFSAFPNSPAFCSWITLCPNHSITGGKTISSRTRKSKNRLAKALRLSAQSLNFSHSALGGWFRRIKGRLGPAQANTAGAHKLARIIFHMITSKQAYNDDLLHDQNQQYLRRREAYIRKQAQAIGYTLVPFAASV